MLDPFKDGFTVREAEQGRCIFYEKRVRHLSRQACPVPDLPLLVQT
jgi:hypothetical protein